MEPQTSNLGKESLYVGHDDKLELSHQYAVNTLRKMKDQQQFQKKHDVITKYLFCRNDNPYKLELLRPNFKPYNIVTKSTENTQSMYENGLQENYHLPELGNLSRSTPTHAKITHHNQHDKHHTKPRSMSSSLFLTQLYEQQLANSK